MLDIDQGMYYIIYKMKTENNIKENKMSKRNRINRRSFKENPNLVITGKYIGLRGMAYGWAHTVEDEDGTYNYIFISKGYSTESIFNDVPVNSNVIVTKEGVKII